MIVSDEIQEMCPTALEKGTLEVQGGSTKILILFSILWLLS